MKHRNAGKISDSEVKKGYSVTDRPSRPISDILVDFFVHMRLKFNVILVPLFLFGLFVSEGSSKANTFWLQFFVLHVLAYGGINSLNSYYDRDEGPIGGLEKPPKIVDDSVFYLAWFVQLLGLYLSTYAPLPFLVWYIAGITISVLYSHPSIRLKSNPIASALLVSIMQGFGGYSGGWIAGGTPLGQMLSLKGLLGGIGIQLVTLGLYPLTQVYQLKDDLKHGDVTIAVALGAKRTFAFSLTFIFAGGCFLTCLIAKFYSTVEAVGLQLYILGLLWYTYKWGKNFDMDNIKYNFKVLHAISFINSAMIFFYTMSHITGLATKIVLF